MRFSFTHFTLSYVSCSNFFDEILSVFVKLLELILNQNPKQLDHHSIKNFYQNVITINQRQRTPILDVQKSKNVYNLESLKKSIIHDESISSYLNCY